MEYEIFSNERIDPDVFEPNYNCGFCPGFQIKLVKISDSSDLLICKGCLTKMINAIMLNKMLLHMLPNKENKNEKGKKT